jgi:hypothetical protein
MSTRRRITRLEEQTRTPAYRGGGVVVVRCEETFAEALARTTRELGVPKMSRYFVVPAKRPSGCTKEHPGRRSAAPSAE